MLKRKDAKKEDGKGGTRQRHEKRIQRRVYRAKFEAESTYGDLLREETLRETQGTVTGNTRQVRQKRRVNKRTRKAEKPRNHLECKEK